MQRPRTGLVATALAAWLVVATGGATACPTFSWTPPARDAALLAYQRTHPQPVVLAGYCPGWGPADDWPDSRALCVLVDRATNTTAVDRTALTFERTNRGWQLRHAQRVPSPAARASDSPARR